MVPRFRLARQAGSKHVFDEIMIKFTGHLGIQQWLVNKPIPRGVKAWMVCDGDGHPLNFEIYQGARHPTHQGIEGTVLDLTEHFSGDWRTLYVDNFFTSIPLILKLHQRQTYCCGTVRE